MTHGLPSFTIQHTHLEILALQVILPLTNYQQSVVEEQRSDREAADLKIRLVLASGHGFGCFAVANDAPGVRTEFAPEERRLRVFGINPQM